MWTTPKDMPAEIVYRRLWDKKILVRYFAQGRLANWLRISIGTDSDMQILLKALAEVIQAGPQIGVVRAEPFLADRHSPLVQGLGEGRLALRDI